MEANKLNKWAEQLLDIAKRNNLVNFHDTKHSTVEVVVPDAAELFEKVGTVGSFEVYDPKDLSILDNDPEEEEEQHSSGRKNRSDEEEKPTREKYIERYKEKIKRNKVLLYSSTSNPLVALKNIDKKAKSAIDETGVNTAYLAFGFVHWKENEYADSTFRAPLLLVPVTFSNESSVSPYYIKPAEDEVVLNPTFAYKISSEEGIKLPELGEDEGLVSYLDRIRELVSKKGWAVTSEVKLGIFSFQKINMYHDLMENQEEILKNKNVKVLLGSGDTDTVSITGDYDTDQVVKNELVDLHTVVDADSSQIEAIEMAKNGKSFVLQGPPGTGKSQTITNLIAECLADGKKVLFVSEKLAALNVVFDKLKQAELEDFCLELHSHKANKKDVIEELCRTLDLPKAGVKQWVNKEVEEKIKAQNQLNAYEKALHKPQDVIEMTAFQLYSAYSHYRALPDINYSIKNISKKDQNYLSECENLLEEYAEYIPTIGMDYTKNPWYGYRVEDASYMSDIEASELFGKAMETARRLAVPENKLSKYEIACNTLNQIQPWIKAKSIFSRDTILNPSLFDAAKLQAAVPEIEKAAALSKRIKDRTKEINAECASEIYQMDAVETLKKLKVQYKGIISHLFNAEYKQIIGLIQGYIKDGSKVNYSRAVEIMERLADYQTSTSDLVYLHNTMAAYLGSYYKEFETNWCDVLKTVDELKSLLNSGLNFGTLCKFDYEQFNQERIGLLEAVSEIENAFSFGEDPIKEVASQFDPEVFDVRNSDIESLCKRFEDCIDEIPMRDNWKLFNRLLGELQKQDLGSYIQFAIEHKIPKEAIKDIYVKAFYKEWIGYVLHGEPALGGFARIIQDKAVETFSEKDILQFGINKKKIKAELSAKRPSSDMIAAGSPIQILRREGGKKRKQKNIRQLLAETGELVQILKPCFLMSPLSVSTFLAPGSVHFDVVIFDEASQIFPQDAVGAIYRGNQLIVVGDSRQMPPTNFFNASVEEEGIDDEEAGDVTDFESILDLCATSMPQLRLKWHYRSRYEQLIAFSNSNFYNNTLVTFPSSKGDEKWVGVDYYHVDGIFDRKSKTNRDEAEYIVELVYENIQKFPDRSLGVVAFSVSQQDLIERLISKRREKDDSGEEFFRKDSKEPFFVKNLETVQGDERDTIIFSVAYGKDDQGRLLMNFGPLNRAGGERRLNVAVTRAKKNVQLVSSMHYTDIDLSRTQAVGAKLLRDYLDYAENGSIALKRTIIVSPDEQYDSDFEMEVHDFLTENGFELDTQVGCSSFKIDLALKIPGTSDYVLAIECDGASYHSSRNARDRDRLRQEILERMGWKFYRIWSTDWFKNKAIEKQKLIAACDEALANPHKVVKNEEKEEKTEELIAQMETKVFEPEFEFPKYEEMSVYDVRDLFHRDFPEMIRKILLYEAPLSEEYLLRRLAPLFGRQKVTVVVRDEYENRMRRCSSYGIVRKNGFLYLKGEDDYVLRVPNDIDEKRDIKDISPEELGSGMIEIIRQNISISKEGLYKKLNELLGYQRLTEGTILQFDEALYRIAKRLSVEDDSISLKSSKRS